MTVKEYLSQGYRLEHRIKLLQEEIKELREMAASVSSPGFEKHYSATRNTSAPFERVLMKIYELEEKQAEALERLLCFKQELSDVIRTLQNKDERLVLYYRYIGNKTWVEIGSKLGWDERTIRRWHRKAMDHLVLPEHITIVEDLCKTP